MNATQRAATSLFQASAIAVGLLLASLIQGCAALDPIDAAETVEQKAFALYGTFVIFEERAAELIVSPDVPVEVKRVIQSTDQAAKPVADSLLALTREAAAIRADVDASPDDLALIADRIDDWIIGFEPLLSAFIEAVGDAL